jgi:sugar lactone lactonase YvrE
VRGRWSALLIAVILIAGVVCAAAERALTALAPFDTYADGFTDVRGLVVDDTGQVFVADRAAGTVVRVATDRTQRVVARGLERPIGVALDAAGRLLVVEERAARVVRLEPGGGRTRLITGIKQPRWLAVGEDGAVYVSARRLTRGTDPEPDDESAEPEAILVLDPSGLLTVFVDGLRAVQGLAVEPGGLFAATQGRRHEPRDGEILRIPILAGGLAGVPTSLTAGTDIRRPQGIVRDRLGAVYVTAAGLTPGRDPSGDAIAKARDARVTRFAGPLARAQGLAFDSAGNLFVADGSRIVRFSAPPAPALTAPVVSRMPSVELTGRTEPLARVDVLVNDAPTTLEADAAGRFTLSITLAEDSTNRLEAAATTHRGDGLASAPAHASVVHDAIAPLLAFDAPPTHAHVRRAVSVRATASDGSHVVSLTLGVDGGPLATTTAPARPASSRTAAATWDTQTMGDGAHTLIATAIDAAGNSATTSRVVVVDNTPPETEITTGPAGTLTEASATFGFIGRDELTPAAGLEFAWRLDGGAFSEFSSATSATLADVAVGSHVFEVKARDRAGNEDPSPARRSFSRGTLSVSISEPGAGTTVREGLVLVRGAVVGPGEVGVVVNGAPALVQGSAFSTLAAVTPPASSLTAIATGAGLSASATVVLGVSPADPGAPALRATPRIGTAPLAVRFVLAGGTTPKTIELDLEGTGAVDFSGPSLDGEVFTYATPGSYLARATVTDASGVRSSATTAVFVLDEMTLDAMLQLRWRDMKDSLRRSAIEEALGHVAARERDEYRVLLGAIAHRLPAVDQILTDIVFVEHEGTRVEYEMVRVEDGREMSYYVLFVLDDDGIWRLEFF